MCSDDYNGMKRVLLYSDIFKSQIVLESIEN